MSPLPLQRNCGIREDPQRRGKEMIKDVYRTPVFCCFMIIFIAFIDAGI